MPKIRTVLRILALILIGFLAWVAIQPDHPLPNVSVTLLSYTNDTTGKRLAMIAVTNLSAFEIAVYRPTIEIPAPKEQSGFAYYFQGNANQWHQFHSVLGKGTSGKFAIPPPASQTPWRLSFFVYTDLGAAQVLKRLVRGARYMPYEVRGEWINSDK